MDGSKLLEGGALQQVKVMGGPLFTTTDVPATPPFDGCKLRGYTNSCHACFVKGQKKRLADLIPRMHSGSSKYSVDSDEEENEEAQDDEEKEVQNPAEPKGTTDATFFIGHRHSLPKNSALLRESNNCLGNALHLMGDREQLKPKTARDILKLGDEFASKTNDEERAAFSKATGCTGRPIFHMFREFYDIRKNTIHDFMHLFYNVVLLSFEYIVRMHVSGKRKPGFFLENRKIQIESEQKNNDEAMHRTFVTYFYSYNVITFIIAYTH